MRPIRLLWRRQAARAAVLAAAQRRDDRERREAYARLVALARQDDEP